MWPASGSVRLTRLYVLRLSCLPCFTRFFRRFPVRRSNSAALPPHGVQPLPVGSRLLLNLYQILRSEGCVCFHMSRICCHQLSAHKPLLHALPHYVLKQAPEHSSEAGFPPPELKDCAVIRYLLIQVDANIPAKCVAARTPFFDLTL